MRMQKTIDFRKTVTRALKTRRAHRWMAARPYKANGLYGFALNALGLVAVLFLPALGQAQTISVDGPTALAQALQTAPRGAVLELAAGDYGALDIRGDISATVLRSANPGTPARFSSAMVQGVDDLTIEGLVFDYRYRAGDQPNLREFQWRDVSRLRLQGNVFDGDVGRGLSADDNGYGIGFGAVIRGGRDIHIEGNRIRGFWKGLLVRETEGLVVVGNDVSEVRSDGMNFVQVAHARIEGNHIHSFHRSLSSEDHSDMIQIWTAQTEWPSHDVVIRGNVLNAGTGWYTQSIFMGNERARQDRTNTSLYYRDITIENNVIINAHLHGITVGQVIGLTIRNNTVVQNPSAATGDPSEGLYTPRIRVAELSRDVTISGNVTSQVDGYTNQPSWRVADNLLIQGPSAYRTVFVGGPAADPQSYRMQSGTYGAPMLR